MTASGGVVCVGVDVGGTFTDVVLTRGTEVHRAKAPTDPQDFGRSVLDACHAVATRAGTTLDALLPTVQRFGLGTTAVTNVLTARTGARVGLITTAGFEDELPVAKGHRIADGVWSVYPDPLVPRERIVGVRERIDRDGAIRTPLDPAAAAAAARLLVAEHDVDALAVSFLWSFRNPVHERQAVAAIEEATPGIPVLSGAALHPTIREFERTSYAVLNAYTVHAVAGIEALADALTRHGLRVPVLLVHSGGGSVTTADARRTPIGLAASGPAAGVAASVALAAETGADALVTCDMGGTSFDVAVTDGGRVPRRTRSELADLLTSASTVDVTSIGAGGGSLAWVDARGMLRVGPQSAGASPGPACYGRGGTEPTVTDALLLLGYLDPDRFLGGEMRLDAAAARAACEQLGKRIGLDAEECAWGIRRLALDGMTTSVGSLLDTRGLAASGRTLVSYGGCGALFSTDLAAELGVHTVLVPELSSVLSAYGAATADLRCERARSLTVALPGDPAALAAVAEELRDQVLADLDRDGVAEADRSVSFEADLRFKRQVWELTVPVAAERLDEAALAAMLEDFRADYTRRYGTGSMMLGAPVELVTLRAVGSGRTTKPAAAAHEREPVAAGTAAPVTASRRVRLDRADDGWREVAAHDGEALRPGHRVAGPALVDARDTTVWVPPGASADVRPDGTLAVTVTTGASGAGTASPDDPIALELLRSQLAAVAEEAAGAIERTAISPVVTESKDYSATLLDARGDLVAGGGVITYHWVAATRAIRATLERYGDGIAPGDVFLANDPYNGGGLHPNDVFVQRPVFVGGELVAWAALSAHLIDMGGMAMGSFAPAATDCYQEALRIPPVRLLRGGVEVSDVWDIFRTNVRLDVLVEMDLRGLVAGANVAHDKVAALATARGTGAFTAGLAALQRLSEREFRRRIATIEDGSYRSTTWVEWDDELYEVPCTLTVDGDALHFDFTGASPQAPHFFNSKPYIIKSGFMMQAAWLLAPDLPYTEGLLAPVTLDCPAGSIVDSTPPAPVNAGHMHVAFAAAEVMSHCLRLAMWASPNLERPCPVTGMGGYSALALTTWSGVGLDGVPDTWMLMDGAWVGASAGEDRDGLDLGSTPVGFPQPPQFPDVEILESWYPMLVDERRVRDGVNGAGAHRSGGGTVLTLRPHGTDVLTGQILGMRAYVPLEAATVYGVEIDPAGRVDTAATAARRAAGRRDRLAQATRALAMPPADAAPDGADERPLFPGVVQRGRYAVAAGSGAVLSVAPGHFTDGCPTLDEPVAGDRVLRRCYLDPVTGALLHVEVLPAGHDRAFAVCPQRWVTAARGAPAQA